MELYMAFRVAQFCAKSFAPLANHMTIGIHTQLAAETSAGQQ